jgi:hypothetical protein
MFVGTSVSVTGSKILYFGIPQLVGPVKVAGFIAKLNAKKSWKEGYT